MAQVQQYGDVHRAFLQAVMARSTVTFAEAQPVLAAILSIHDQREIHPLEISMIDFNSFISTLNSALEPLDYEIRSTVHQNRSASITGNEVAATPTERIWALVNTTSDPFTQLATTLGPDEIAFVKRILDAMFLTYNTRSSEIMAVSDLEAVKLNKPSRRSQRESIGGETQTTQGASGSALTLTRAEEVLSGLVDEGWFETSKAGFYCLSPRALMELRSWLVETYNEEPDDGDEEERWDRIKFCEACRDIVTIGQRCATRECNCRLHNNCESSFFRNQPARRCPKCKTEWSGSSFVGEKAAKRPARRSTAAVNRAATMATEDENGAAGSE